MDVLGHLSRPPFLQRRPIKPASNLTGLSADSSGAPLASDASLGHPANRSNTLGDDDVSERGPDDIDRDVADPMGNGALGTDPLAV